MKELIKSIIKFLTHRLFILLVVIIGMFYILFNRIFELQIVQGETLEQEFSLFLYRERELEGQRGNIYDRNGFPLAENTLAYTVQLDGSIPVDDKNKMALDLFNTIEANGDEVIKSFPIGIDIDGNYIFTENDAKIYRFKKDVFVSGTTSPLSEEELKMQAKDMFLYIRDELFEIPSDIYSDQEIINILHIRYPLWLKRYAQYRLETISVKISPQTLANIEENIVKFPGVSVIEDPLRVYNYPEYFSHIIGYIGQIDAETLENLKPLGYDNNDIVGRIGIEKEMEVYLNGTDGFETVEVDNLGRTMDVIDIIEPAAGKDVYLTIDKDLQIECYNILEKELANILQNKLKITPYKDEQATLMKDVFTSLFNNGMISIDEIEQSKEDEHQNVIYNIFIDNYNKIIGSLDFAVNVEDVYMNEELSIYYEYILEKLNIQGYLSNNYKNLSAYGAFSNNEIGFNGLLMALIDSSDLEIEHKEGSFEKAIDTLIDEYIHYPSFKKLIYKDIAQREIFSYLDLCLTLVEQGVVSASDEQIKQLKSYQLSSVEFMKEKILNLEITPQELALDPSSGSVVVTDVNTGEVLAMVSYPSYDNNKIINGVEGYYTSLLNDPTKPLFSRATHGKSAPGSTFKMVSAMAALEENVVTYNEHMAALGLFKKVSPYARCWIYGYGSTHGSIDIAEALEVSCNYFFYEVGYRLSLDKEGNFIDVKGIQALTKYAEMFGLGTKTGIETGEASPHIATEKSVRASIGQSDNNYTPVQLARYIATLANGGICYELNLIDKVLNNDGNIFFDKTPAITRVNNFKEENITQVQQGMLQVTQGSSGTAKWSFRDFPIDVAGKTGSAQESSIRPDHSLFVTYAPFDNPEIAVVNVIPFGYGSVNSLPIVKDVIASYYDIYEAKDSYSYSHLLDE